MLKLRFPVTDLQHWYARNTDKSWVEVQRTGHRCRSVRYLSKVDFTEICSWKSPRSKHQCASNNEDIISELTRASLGSPLEELRITYLTLLRGVSWPTASAILHFCHEEEYPILDFRALWSLGVKDEGKYNFELWWSYTKKCRSLALKSGMSLRELDMALWQYSKENQPVRSS